MKGATYKPTITDTSEPYENLFTRSANTKPDLEKQLFEFGGRRRFVLGGRSWSESGGGQHERSRSRWRGRRQQH